MSRQYKRSLSRPVPPNSNEHHAWPAYWQAQNQAWRTEQQIDKQRQEELTTCRANKSNVDEGIYPFKGKKLTRADIEWLLASQEGEHGPLQGSNVDLRQRRGRFAWC